MSDSESSYAEDFEVSYHGRSPSWMLADSYISLLKGLHVYDNAWVAIVHLLYSGSSHKGHIWEGNYQERLLLLLLWKSFS